MLIDYFITKTEVNQNKIYDGLIKKDKQVVEELREESEKLMRIKYIFYYILFVIFSAFCLYYSTIFCTIYRGSSKNWLSDGFVGIITDYTMKIIFIFLLSFTRVGVRKYQIW